VYIQKYDFDRVLEPEFRLDVQAPRLRVYPFITSQPGRSMPGRATVLLRPLTHMLMLTSDGSNLQNEKQGQIRRNYYNT
jgi:hypothetical protein